MDSHKETTINALSNMLGDDLNRAISAFRNCTPDQMQEQYGQSGQTRADVIKEYESHNSKILAAIKWVESLPDNR